MLLPRAGVYATLTQLEGGPLYHSLTNVGVRPTFRTGGGATVETHIDRVPGGCLRPMGPGVVLRLPAGGAKFETRPCW